MGNAQGYSAEYSGMGAASDGLLNVHADLQATVRQSEAGCTEPARIVPNLSTFVAAGEVFTAHSAVVTAHAQNLGGYGETIAANASGYQQADNVNRVSVINTTEGV